MPPTPDHPKRGIWENSRTNKSGLRSEDNLVDRVADFSYESDALAQLIVDMWGGAHGDLLKAPNDTDYGQRSSNAKAVFAARGIYFEQPIVITEDEYQNGSSWCRDRNV